MANLKLDDKGERVVALQEALETIGFPEPRFGADGIFGQLTLELIQLAWTEFGFDNDPTPDQAVPVVVEEAILALAAAQRELSRGKPEQSSASVGTFPLVVDYRDESWDGKETRRNPVASIDTICLHQMAVASVGTTQRRMKPPESLRQYGEAETLVDVPTRTGKIERWKKLSIHFAITCGPESKAYLMHDLDWRLPHGHGWNPRSVGLEFEGYFAGRHDLSSGEYRNFWKPSSRPNRRPMIPTEQQLEAGRQCCRYIVSRIAELGGEIKFVGAHRQSYGIKASDPGALIWKGVAIPIMQEFGLRIAPTLHHSKYPGRPTPESWDPSQAGVPYRD